MSCSCSYRPREHFFGATTYRLHEERVPGVDTSSRRMSLRCVYKFKDPYRPWDPPYGRGGSRSTVTIGSRGPQEGQSFEPGPTLHPSPTRRVGEWAVSVRVVGGTYWIPPSL